MTENEYFGENLSKLMERDCVSGNRLAKMLGLTAPAVSQYRNGWTTPSEENLQKIAEIFNCSTDYLLGRNENPSPDYNVQNACLLTGLSEEAISNIKKYSSYCETDLKTGDTKDYKGELGEILNGSLSSLWLRPLLISIYNYRHIKEIILTRLNSNEMQEGDPLQSVIDMQRDLSAAMSEVIYNFTGMMEEICGTARLRSGLVREEAKLRDRPKLDFNAAEFLNGLMEE